MGGNIPVGNLLGGNFQEGIHQDGIFQVGVFLISYRLVKQNNIFEMSKRKSDDKLEILEKLVKKIEANFR